MDIHDGCENGNIHLVVTLLKEGKATLADRDENGNTPLHNACLGAQIKLVRLFLGQSIDYTYISDGKQGGAVAVQIRTQGEDPDEEATEEFGRTAVNNFSLPKRLTINVQALKHADKIYRDNYGSTPLNTLCALGSTTETDAKIARLLLEAGDPVNVSKKSDRMSPVSWAAYHGDLELLQVLLDPCIGPRANPIWASAPHNAFPIDLAGLRAVANMYGGLSMTKDRKGALEGSDSNGRVTLTSGQLGQGQDPASCCQHLVSYGVQNLGHECKYAEAGGGLRLRPSDLLRYRTHLLYWASCFGMTKEVRILMASREDGLKFLAQRIAGTTEIEIRNRADSMDSESGADDRGGERKTRVGDAAVDEESGLHKRAEFDVNLPNSRDSVYLIRNSHANVHNAASNQAQVLENLTSLAMKAMQKPGEIGQSAGTIGYSEIFIGGAIFSPIDGDDEDTVRSDGGGGAVLTALEPHSPAVYDGNLVKGQRLVAINGVDCSHMTFRQVASLALRAMASAMDDESRAAAMREGVPHDRIRIRLRDPDLYATAHWRTAHWLDVNAGVQRARDELNTLSPLARCAPLVKWQSPLHIACERGMSECVAEMIESINREDRFANDEENRLALSEREGWFNSEENTPLHLAAAGNHVQCVLLLLKATPPIHIGFPNSAGWSEYGIAMKRCRKYIRRLRRHEIRNFNSTDPGWEFVAVFDSKYVRELKHVIEGLTNESEETPGVQLKCSVYQWSPPGRVQAAQAARNEQISSLKGMELFKTPGDTQIDKPKRSGGRCYLSMQRILACACCKMCCSTCADDHTRRLYLLIKCTESSYAVWAEQMGLKQSRRTSVLREQFRADMKKEFEPFRSLEKQQILFDIIRRKFDVVKYKKRGTILSFFGLHHARGRDRVVETWDPWLKRPGTKAKEMHSLKGMSIARRRHQANTRGGCCSERSAANDTDSDTDIDTETDTDSSDDESRADSNVSTPRSSATFHYPDTVTTRRGREADEKDFTESNEKTDVRLSREIEKREARLRRARRRNKNIHHHYKPRMSRCAYYSHGWLRRCCQLPHMDCCRFCSSLEGRDYPELTSLRNYFGQKMAGYFAWFEYHTHALAFLAGSGVVAELIIQAMIYAEAYNDRIHNTGVGTSTSYNATAEAIPKWSESFNISGASQLQFITTEITTSDGLPPTDIKSSAGSKMADAFIEWLGIDNAQNSGTPWLYILNDYTLLGWAIIVCVWTTLASEGWKRLLSQLYCIWGVEDGDADRYVRPEFIGDTRVPVNPSSFADGRTQLFGNRRMRYVMYIIQLPVMGTMIAIVIIAWWYVNYVKESGMFIPLACRTDYIDPDTGWDWRNAALVHNNSDSGASTIEAPVYATPPAGYEPVYTHEITTCAGESCAKLAGEAFGNRTFIVSNVSRVVPYCCGPGSDACAAAKANFFDTENLKSNGIIAAYSIVITLTNYLWGEMALLFTHWENHAHDSDFEVSLGLKTFTFQFLNSYMSLFWYAFVALDHDMLRAQLANLMIFKQLSDYLLYLVLPWLTYRISLFRRGLPFRRLFAHYSIESNEDSTDIQQGSSKNAQTKRKRRSMSTMTDAELAARYLAAQEEVENELCRCLKEYYAKHNPAREFEVKEKVRRYLRKGGVRSVEMLFEKIEEKYGEAISERSYSDATLKIAEGPAPYGTQSQGGWGASASPVGTATIGHRGHGKWKRNKVHSTEDVDAAGMFRCPTEKLPLMEQVGMQESMHKQPSVITFYVRAIVQFGYVSMFGECCDVQANALLLCFYLCPEAVSFPLAPMFSVVNNMLQIPFEITMLTGLTQRPLSTLNTEETPDPNMFGLIDLVMAIQEFMTYASVTTNCAILFFTFANFGEAGFGLERGTSTVTKLWVIIGIEHGLILLKGFLAKCIQDAPAWVIAEREARAQKHIRDSQFLITEGNKREEAAKRRIKQLNSEVVALRTQVAHLSESNSQPPTKREAPDPTIATTVDANNTQTDDDTSPAPVLVDETPINRAEERQIKGAGASTYELGYDSDMNEWGYDAGDYVEDSNDEGEDDDGDNNDDDDEYDQEKGRETKETAAERAHRHIADARAQSPSARATPTYAHTNKDDFIRHHMRKLVGAIGSPAVRPPSKSADLTSHSAPHRVSTTAGREMIAALLEKRRKGRQGGQKG